MALQLDVEYAEVDEDCPSSEDLSRWAETALLEAGHQADAEVALRIVGSEEGQALNRDYRGRDYATNVLSFPFEAPPGLDDLPMLGDLAICAPVVLREAGEQDKAASAHWAHMTVHGILHLLGHDHQNDDEAEIMESLERRILERLGFPDPYHAER